MTRKNTPDYGTDQEYLRVGPAFSRDTGQGKEGTSLEPVSESGQQCKLEASREVQYIGSQCQPLVTRTYVVYVRVGEGLDGLCHCTVLSKYVS